MGRRCDRAGVAWPRIGHAVEGAADELLGRLWHLTLTARALWDDACDAREARCRDHDRAMSALRERPALP